MKLHNYYYHVCDACDTGLPREAYSTVVACGIIHHLPIERAFREIKRLLKPGGSLIMFEPLGENPLFNFYRNVTPQARTPDETPLVRADIMLLRELFPDITIRFFGLTTLLSVPFRHHLALYNCLYEVFYRIDQLLFLTPLRWWAWMIVAVAKK